MGGTDDQRLAFPTTGGVPDERRQPVVGSFPPVHEDPAHLVEVLVQNQYLVILLDDLDGIGVHQSQRDTRHETAQRRVLVGAEAVVFRLTGWSQSDFTRVAAAHAGRVLRLPDAFEVGLGGRARRRQGQSPARRYSRKRGSPLRCTRKESIL